MVSDPEAAESAWLIQLAMDASDGIDPAPRLSSLGYKLLDRVIGTDYLPGGKLGAQQTLYGLVLEKDGVIIVANRGTRDILEWIEDAEFLMVDHPRGGKVEQGFYGVYGTLTIGGTPAWRAIANMPNMLRILGHSLAADLAAYLTLDVPDAEGIYLAQPKTGDDAFVAMFDKTVPKYRTMNYNKDVVPDLPWHDMGYRDLPKTVYFTSAEAQAQTNDWDVACRHSCLAYCARLDFSKWCELTGGRLTSCIKGATTA